MPRTMLGMLAELDAVQGSFRPCGTGPPSSTWVTIGVSE